MKETTTYSEYTTNSTLYLAFELGEKDWKLAFTIGLGQDPRRRSISSRDTQALHLEIARAKQRFGLPEDAPVLSCYEAGREGFWLHRHLLAQGIDNIVVDSASIEVSRRRKRPKTDRLDAGKLVSMLIRYHCGEKKVWSVVNVPSPLAEDNRHLHRQLKTLKNDRTRHINRIKGYLANYGLRLPVKDDFLDSLSNTRLWDGSPLPPGLLLRLHSEFTCLQFLALQINQLETHRQHLLRTSDDPAIDMVRRLMRLKGIGINSAWLFVMEFFAWRDFRNRRQIGGLSGLSPTPFQSGDESRELGISKAGNCLIRTMAIEVSWSWVRHQPDSLLTLWWLERFAHGSKRLRKIGIVALSRKLLVALWRYLEFGEIPPGAQLKPADQWL